MAVLSHWSPSKKKKVFIIIIIVLSLLVSLGVVLGICLSKKSLNPGPGFQTDSEKENLLSASAQFPNGSYAISVNNLQQGRHEMAPLTFNIKNLSQMGIIVDNSSFVAEAGRLNYFYVLLPSRSRILSSDLPNIDIGSIGVRFGSTDQIRIVPLSLASVPLSGVRAVSRMISGDLYEIQVGIPQSLCSSNDQSICSAVQWSAYSIASDGKTGAGVDTPTIMPVACGSQCEQDSNSLCATSTCQSCDGVQVAGADTPVTRRYNMGTTSGNVTFEFETYSVPDRIRVFYENSVIYDTGCVGNSGHTTLSFSGFSKEVRVDVWPNCQGTTGTAWNFKLSCPNPCSGNGDFYLMNGLQQVKEGDTVYISKQALMPTLTSIYCGVDNPIWSLVINPSKTYSMCSISYLSGYGSSWSIPFYGGIMGGDANLTLKSNSLFKSLNFRIRGSQPSNSDVISEISQIQQDIWFAPYVAKHESNFVQFNEDGTPMKSFDNGYGIYQLTNPTPTCDQIWNWKSNILEGVSRLRSALYQANTWMSKQRFQAKSETGSYQTVTVRQEGNCCFKDGTSQTIEAAVAMKIFNGASNGHYCAWENAPAKQWKFNPLNNLNFNYVARVCNEVPKSFNQCV